MDCKRFRTGHAALSALAALGVSLWWAPQAAASPDPDGAISALIDWPLKTAGDLAGSVGLIGGGLCGGAGDGIALIDDNPYTRVVLRGAFSQSLRRLALGWSNLFTGGLEGLRAEDLERYPESAESHLSPDNAQVRIDPVLDGLGGGYVGITDFVGQPLLVILRGVGAAGPAASIEGWQTKVRERYFGPELEN